jgi:hypothetical protein
MKRKEAEKRLNDLLKLQAELFLERDKTDELKEIIDINLQLEDIDYELQWLDVNYFKYL